MMESAQLNQKFNSQRVIGIGAMDGGQVPARGPDVDSAMEEIERHAMELFEMAQALAERLAPILSSANLANTKDSLCNPSNCPLSGRIRNVDARLTAQGAVLAAILESLQI